MRVTKQDALRRRLHSAGSSRTAPFVASALLSGLLAMTPAPAIGQDLAGPSALGIQAVLPELRSLLAELDRERTRIVELMNPTSNLLGLVSRYERAATAVEVHGTYIDRIFTMYLISHEHGRLPVAPETFDALAEALDFATAATAPSLQSLVDGDDLVQEYRVFVPRDVREAMDAIRVQIAGVRSVWGRLSALIPARR